MSGIDEPVEIVAYDERWRDAFQTESLAIREVADASTLGIEHIGSTAVPGLAAKPIVDIMIGVAALPPTEQLVLTLRGLGYEYFGEAGVPGRHYFRKRGAQGFNLALVEYRGELWRANLAIRDALKSDGAAAREYERVKLEAIASGRTMLIEYSAAKSEYLERLLSRACAP